MIAIDINTFFIAIRFLLLVINQVSKLDINIYNAKKLAIKLKHLHAMDAPGLYLEA